MTINERRAKYRKEHRARLRETAAARYKANPEPRRANSAATRAKALGITPEEYRERGERSCEICGHLERTRENRHVDHDHDTNQVRGTLCKDCNLGLGRFDDSQPRLLSAVRYLARYGG